MKSVQALCMESYQIGRSKSQAASSIIMRLMKLVTVANNSFIDTK